MKVLACDRGGFPNSIPRVCSRRPKCFGREIAAFGRARREGDLWGLTRLVERLGPPLNTRTRQGGVTFSLSESDLPVSETPPRRYARCPCFRVIFAGRINAPITRRADRPLPLNRAVFSSAECPAAMRFTHSTAPDSCRCSCQSRNRSRTSSSRLGGPMARRRPALPRRRWHSRAKCGPRSGA